MNISRRKAVSTTIVAIIIVVLAVAAIAGIYLASQNHSTTTTTVTSSVTTSITGTGSTVTTTTTASGSSSGTIPANTVVEGIVDPEWLGSNVGDDVQCGWGDQSMWFNNNYEQLFQWDPYQLSQGNYVPVPWLANNYTESADGLTWTINLQQGVHFHSGDVMTAADVVYSVDRYVFATNESSTILNCAGGGLGYRDSFASMKSITATGTDQVTLTLNYADPNILAELANQGMSILDSKLLQAHTVTGANGTSDWGFTWLDAGPNDAGTGPFQMTSFTYEQRAELQAFSGYWGGPFNNFTSDVKTIIQIPYSDATTAQFALEQGQINMVQDETSTAISSIASTPGYTTDTAPAFAAFGLWMHAVGPLANWENRDAVKDAINYTAVIQAVTAGYGKPDDSIFYLGMQGFNSTTANYYAKQGPNDTGALALEKLAGNPNGFTVNLYTRPSSRYGVTFVDMAEVLQSDLAAVNITLNIQVYVVGEFYDLAENASLPGIWTVPGSLIILSPLSNMEEAIGNSMTTYDGWSIARETGPGVSTWGPQLFQLYNESQTAATPALALQYESQFDQLYLKYGPEVQMFQIPNTVAYSTSIKGVIWSAVSDAFIPEGISVT